MLKNLTLHALGEVNDADAREIVNMSDRIVRYHMSESELREGHRHLTHYTRDSAGVLLRVDRHVDNRLVSTAHYRNRVAAPAP